MILVSFENVKKYFHVVKSTLFEIFSTLRVLFRHPPFEKISNNVEFSLWGKQCICAVKMRPKLWKSHIARRDWLRFIGWSICCCWKQEEEEDGRGAKLSIWRKLGRTLFRWCRSIKSYYLGGSTNILPWWIIAYLKLK